MLGRKFPLRMGQAASVDKQGVGLEQERV